jgi:cytochrome P450
LDKTQLFLAKLEKYASTGEDFLLDDLCTNLTFDIIGAVTMDIDLDAQLGDGNQSAIVQLFQKLGSTYRSGNNSWKMMLPLRRKVLSRQLGASIKERIKEKFEEQSKSEKPSRSVLGLSLAETHELTPEVLDRTCDQLKTFLFAGHDTTSIMLQWAFYELTRTPHALRLVRQELDEVFGPDSTPNLVRDQILEHGEELLQKLSYTAAVIKETLRLYPPAATARFSNPNTGFTVQLPNGQDMCLDGMMLYNCQSIIQRDSAVYGDDSNQFNPQRWLEADSAIPASAWRPFERGPRNCIGQELANIEALVILACTARRYDWEKVGLGMKRDESGAPIQKENGQYEVESELYNVSIKFTACKECIY